MFDLTRQERQVALFLIGVALVGIGINFFAKRYQPIKSFVCFDKDIGKIDLNTADKDLFLSVSGIGEKLAQRILEYRETNGRFNSLEELKSIKGITDYRYEKLKDSLCVK